MRIVKDVIMPALGMAQETGRLIRWLKQPGDRVVKGEPLMEVETDKTTVEVEAPATGVLADVGAQADQEVPVGRVIAVIVEAGDVLSDIARQKPDAPATSDFPARTLASPLARRLADENQIDIAGIRGTGPDGAVIARDVRVTIDDRRPPNAVEPSPAVGHWPSDDTSDDTSVDRPLSRMERVTAERLSEAWRTIPHFYLRREAEVLRLNTWREVAMARSAEKITITDVLIKLVAASLPVHPRLNASWHDGKIIDNNDVNIGLAVAVGEGLIVPVIHSADRLRLSEIARRRVEVVSRAKANRLTSSDLNGGTFTISNLGMFGVDEFSAIVNPPQAAILAIGAMRERFARGASGQGEWQLRMTLTLSCDHRVVDGARGARFLQTLVELIEEPMRLLE
jgi:pyruvate dehydrogenase E2 component (dihydrolipoamide acetyltransferase)